MIDAFWNKLISCEFIPDRRYLYQARVAALYLPLINLTISLLPRLQRNDQTAKSSLSHRNSMVRKHSLPSPSSSFDRNIADAISGSLSLSTTKPNESPLRVGQSSPVDLMQFSRIYPNLDEFIRMRWRISNSRLDESAICETLYQRELQWKYLATSARLFHLDVEDQWPVHAFFYLEGLQFWKTRRHSGDFRFMPYDLRV